MKKLEKRAIICLALAAILLLGLGIFAFRFVVSGDDWASFPANQHLFQNGVLNRGRVLDVNGEVLSDSGESGRTYNSSYRIRTATLHVVGDTEGQIGSGALSQFADRLSGFNLFTGVYSINGEGRDLYLTIDAELSAVANEALAGRKGTVGVYNYETGEILCLVSSPNYDPVDPPGIEGDDSYDGVYINRFLSATYTPGSIFKLVTTAAALENKSDLDDWEFVCDGSFEIGEDAITCPSAHGTVDIAEALSVSCNGAFAQLTLELGGDLLERYTEKLGLTDSISINGISTAKGSFTFPNQGDANLAWAGIGQYEDLVNPCSMMVYMGAIANGGVPVLPQIVSKVTTVGGFPLSLYLKKSGSRMLSEDAAAELAELMHNNVVTNYGEGNYPGLDLCAKSGTAEVGGDLEPNAWFVGFIRNEEYPLAFVVLVENGGSGSSVAGSIANKVLQAAVD